MIITHDEAFQNTYMVLETTMTILCQETHAIPDSKAHGSNLGPPGSCRPQMDPILAPWTLLSGMVRRRLLKGPTVWLVNNMASLSTCRCFFKVSSLWWSCGCRLPSCWWSCVWAATSCASPCLCFCRLQVCDGVVDADYWPVDATVCRLQRCLSARVSFFSGFKAALELWQQTANLSMILGPGCSIVCEPVSLMTAYWNLPTVSYSCASGALSDKDVYPTFSRTCSTYVGYGPMVAEVVEAFGYEVAICFADVLCSEHIHWCLHVSVHACFIIHVYYLVYAESWF